MNRQPIGHPKFLEMVVGWVMCKPWWKRHKRLMKNKKANVD